MKVFNRAIQSLLETTDVTVEIPTRDVVGVRLNLFGLNSSNNASVVASEVFPLKKELLCRIVNHSFAVEVYRNRSTYWLQKSDKVGLTTVPGYSIESVLSRLIEKFPVWFPNELKNLGRENILQVRVRDIRPVEIVETSTEVALPDSHETGEYEYRTTYKFLGREYASVEEALSHRGIILKEDDCYYLKDLEGIAEWDRLVIYPGMKVAEVAEVATVTESDEPAVVA